MADTETGSKRIKVWVSAQVIAAAQERAEEETTEARTVHVSDVAKDGLFSVAAQEGDAQERITLREAADRRRFPLWVKAQPYEQAKARLRARGLSVAAVVEESLIRYGQRRDQQR